MQPRLKYINLHSNTLIYDIPLESDLLRNNQQAIKNNLFTTEVK